MRTFSLVALLVAVLAAGPALADAAWDDAVGVSAPGGAATGSANAVAAAPGGRFVVAWTWGAPGTTTTTQVQAQRLGNGRTGERLTLATGTGTVNDVRLWPAPNGRTVATWSSPVGPFDIPITLRTIGADDRLGPPVTVTEPGDSGLGVVAVPQSDGSITVAWIDQTAVQGSIVKARQISAAGTAGPVSTLTAPDAGVDDLVGAADMDGGALLVWTARGVLYGQRITGAGAAARPTFRITPADATVDSPQVATDGTGGATVVWVQQSTPVSVQQVAIVADDKFSGADQLSAPGVAALAPTLAFRNGSGVVAWEAQTAAGTVVVGLDSDGQSTTLSPVSSLLPEVAIDGAGNGFAVWRHTVGSTGTVQAALFGRVPAPQVTTVSAATTEQQYQHIAASPDGRALATWALTTPTGTQVQAAEYTPPRTRLQIDHPTATVSARGRLVLRVRCGATDARSCVGGLRLRRGGVIAQRPLSVRADRVALVPVTLNGRARRQLARTGRLAVEAVVATSQLQTRRVTRVRQRLTLRLANGGAAR